MTSSSDTPRWTPCGLLHPKPAASWSVSHAALPALDPSLRTLYFSTRDGTNRSHIARCGVNLQACALEGAADTDPVLAPGALGTFDDAGVTTSCVVAAGNERRLFYTGWMRGVSIPFYLAAGLAISGGDDAPFERISKAPLLDRSGVDPFLTASPWVIEDGGWWRMWYVSGTAWESTPEGPRHRYHIRYAESSDGIEWRRSGRVAIDYRAPDEYAFGRPCVIKDGSLYCMWYCVRGNAYRLGYAESSDGLDWRRHDAAACTWRAEPGFDDEMQAYPAVYQRDESRWLLYNGNGYGRTGIKVMRTDRART